MLPFIVTVFSILFSHLLYSLVESSFKVVNCLLPKNNGSLSVVVLINN